MKTIQRSTGSEVRRFQPGAEPFFGWVTGTILKGSRISTITTWSMPLAFLQEQMDTNAEKFDAVFIKLSIGRFTVVILKQQKKLATQKIGVFKLNSGTY